MPASLRQPVRLRTIKIKTHMMKEVIADSISLIGFRVICRLARRRNQSRAKPF